MASVENTEYLIVWQKTKARRSGNLIMPARPPVLEYPAFNFLRNLLNETRLWHIDTSQAITTNSITKERHQAQLADEGLFICGFFITKGSVKDLMGLTSRIDLRFAKKYESSLNAAARDEIMAHTTSTFAPIIGCDASIMLVWAKNAGRKPSVPIDLIMDIIHSYNLWGRSLVDRKLMLDTGRINVRFGTRHLDGGKMRKGPRTAGQLVALGSYSKEGISADEALKQSGLSLGDKVIELRDCNGWCAAMTSAQPYQFDPRNGIYV